MRVTNGGCGTAFRPDLGNGRDVEGRPVARCVDAGVIAEAAAKEIPAKLAEDSASTSGREEHGPLPAAAGMPRRRRRAERFSSSVVLSEDVPGSWASAEDSRRTSHLAGYLPKQTAVELASEKLISSLSSNKIPSVFLVSTRDIRKKSMATGSVPDRDDGWQNDNRL
jgi:hypothetical protein